MFLYYLISILVTYGNVEAAPIRVDAPQGSPMPSQRTMFGIVWSCLSTIIICAWTSVHPNVPPPNQWQARWNRLRLMFWMIIAPEMVLAWAVRQFFGAREIRDAYNNRYPDAPKWKKWTLKHGHFLQMGGFSLIDPDQKDAEPNEQNGIVLTLDYFNAHPDIEIPAITVAEIEDKSKGDALSKLIAILQTTWFIVQCIARGLQGLALTELELATLALASLNAVTFAIWWHKPLGVKEPVKIYYLDVDAGTEVEDADRQEGNRIISVNYAALSRSRYKMTSFFSELIEGWRKERNIGYLIESLDTPGPRNDGSEDIELPDTPGPRNDSSEDDIVELPDIPEPRSDSSERSLFSLFFIFSILIIIFVPILALALLVSFIFTAVYDIVTTASIQPSASHVPSFYASSTESDRWSRMVVFALFGIIFGGLHCIGWNFAFPTHAEQVLWRTTSLAITVIPLIVAPIDFLLTTRLDARDVKGFEGVTLTTLDLFMMILLFIYVPARLSLIAQALALLRSQPPSALISVNWTKYVPHLFSS